MVKYKILNLYACLGGNRYKWDEELAKLYQERFPNDIVIVEDAHKYLLDHYKDFDFIWSSPPCPTHSRARFARHESTKNKYPDMKLYQEIIFLENYFKGKYVVENVVPFYEPLIPAKKRGRHLYWTNFNLPTNIGERKEGKGIISVTGDEVGKLCEFHEYDFTKYKGKQRRDKIARNLVDFEVGKTILETVFGLEKQEKIKQLTIF